jgi:hypothetical protein
MRIGISAAIAAAFAAAAASASAACPPGRTPGCVNLDLAPKASQDIAAVEPLSASKATPTSTEKQPYSGPTIGLNDKVRRAPQIGYRWTFN